MTTAQGSYAESVSVEEVAQLKQELMARRKSLLSNDETSNIKNSQWVKQAFLVDEIDLNPIDRINRNHSSAIFKFNDSSLGGSYAINPRPQFTPYADIRTGSMFRWQNQTTLGASYGKLGLGRYYSEAIDDTSQIIHMRFGVPQFNSLTTFFTGFYSGEAASIAKSGRISTSFFRTAGQIFGLVITVTYLPLLILNGLGHAYKFFFKKPSSKFYYLKPSMTPYWTAVNAMVNNIAVNKGLYARVPVLGDSDNSPSLDSASEQQMGKALRIDKELMAELATLMPDVFDKDGGIDIYKVAGRAQRLKVALDDQISKDFASGKLQNFQGFVTSDSIKNLEIPNPNRNTSMAQIIANWMNSEGGSITEDSSKGLDGEISLKAKPNADGTTDNIPYPTKLIDYFRAEWDDGMAFASFKVDYTGPASESFSSSTVESELQQTFNSKSSTSRSARFNFADGNLVGGVVGDMLGGVAGAVKNFATGALDSLNISGIAALGGSAFVDIPKHWESSSASLPRASYTMTLISPYGNPISQMINIYIPLCMLLAGALPLATGKQSYTSPFLLELYDRGRTQTRLGIIDSLSITRGTSNLGFNQEGSAMAVDISFSVADLSSIVSMPIDPGFSLNVLKGIFDDETAYSDYINVLSAMNLSQQVYTLNKFKLRAVNKFRNIYQNVFSATRMLEIVHDKTPLGWLDLLFKGVDR